jgi:hypothetical protein
MWLRRYVGLIFAGFLAATPATAPGQQPVMPAAAEPAAKPTDPPPPKTPGPELKVPDYFGPAPTQPFNEKALFPTAPKIEEPPKTIGPDGLPVIPKAVPVVIPDGTYPPPPKKIWRGGAEFGVTGSQGNSDVFAVRIGMNADRKVETNLLHLDFLYNLTTQDNTTRQNQALFNARDEILFGGTPWSIFSALQLEYDEFRAYDLRVGTYAGLSYRWIKSEDTLLKTRLGAGATREMNIRRGGPPDRWVPEAVVGGDFNHRFTDRQGFVSTVDVFPNLSQLGQFRVRARAGYEIVISPEHGMVLRLGIQDRYDSNPGPAKRNDLNYFTTLLFRF